MSSYRRHRPACLASRITLSLSFYLSLSLSLSSKARTKKAPVEIVASGVLTDWWPITATLLLPPLFLSLSLSRPLPLSVYLSIYPSVSLDPVAHSHHYYHVYSFLPRTKRNVNDC